MVQREDWKIRIRICKDVEIVTKVPAIAGRIPADRTIRLREVTIAIAVKVTGFPAITGMVRTEAGSGNNRSTVASDIKMSGIDHTEPDGFIQEACAEDCEQQAVSFLIGMEGDLGKTINEFSYGFLLNGSSFQTLSFRLLNLLLYGWLDVGREVGRCKIPKPVDEIVEGTNAGKIPGLKSAEDSKEM